MIIKEEITFKNQDNVRTKEIWFVYKIREDGKLTATNYGPEFGF